MPIRELGHIVLYVRDLATLAAFYRYVLGWPEVATVGGWARASLSGRTHHELLLLEVGPDAAEITARTAAGHVPLRPEGR